MTLCRGASCPHYPRKVRIDKQGNARVIKRSCYYEPGCWLRTIDCVVHSLRRLT
jgi:hypothetical protein